ncbi:hypothetical protein HK100_009057, partial [Physocladia obscura]
RCQQGQYNRHQSNMLNKETYSIKECYETGDVDNESDGTYSEYSDSEYKESDSESDSDCESYESDSDYESYESDYEGSESDSEYLELESSKNRRVKDMELTLKPNQKRSRVQPFKWYNKNM